ncbi:protein Atg16l2 isoform X3 [Peromyscus californicus insignis]|uniref:protein Atg16l2 isoform X3 n=1 Tax=Peromyscus californicus insignis TaxID=564181 RepID=UPI0022A6E671|nr:protein Atg16l2 isoform X3 [Peromyscus californicus insignis]
MAGPGSPGGPSAPAAVWKRHIVRQLRHRDRTQKTLFLELVPAYNHLLEKAELLAKFSEKLKSEPEDVTSAPHQDCWGQFSGPASDRVSSAASLRMKWQQEEKELQLVCGEMAYQVVKKSAALDTLQSQLEERQGRLEALQACVVQLSEARAQQSRQLEELQAENAAQREAYRALLEQAAHQEAALRRLQEEARDLLERLVQRKARAAAECNLRNERRERANQARVSQELKRAAKRTVSITEIPNTLEGGAREEPAPLSPVATPEFLESETCEKWKRPFRSASATSLTLSRCMDVVKGLLDFKKRRGHSVGGAPEQRYQSIPVCVSAQIPTQAQDVLDAHLSEVNAVCFGPNSSLLATGGADRLIHLWNVVGGRLEANQTLEGAGGSITSVDFDPSGSQVLAATYNQAAQLWKVGETQSKETLSGHKDKVTAAKFKLTRHQAVTGSRDRTVKEWDLGRAYCEAQSHLPQLLVTGTLPYSLAVALGFMSLGLRPLMISLLCHSCCSLAAFVVTLVFRGRVSPGLGRPAPQSWKETAHLQWLPLMLRLWVLLIGPQVPGPSMYFPTVMTWCAATTSSSVGTMTRRSGSGTAGRMASSAVLTGPKLCSALTEAMHWQAPQMEPCTSGMWTLGNWRAAYRDPTVPLSTLWPGASLGTML